MRGVFSMSKIKMSLERRGRRRLERVTQFNSFPEACRFLTAAGRSCECLGQAHNRAGLDSSMDGHIGHHVPRGLCEHWMNRALLHIHCSPTFWHVFHPNPPTEADKEKPHVCQRLVFSPRIRTCYVPSETLPGFFCILFPRWLSGRAEPVWLTLPKPTKVRPRLTPGTQNWVSNHRKHEKL